jgi:hypothetical protein
VVSLCRLSPHERGLVFDFTRAQLRHLSVARRVGDLCRRPGPRRGDGARKRSWTQGEYRYDLDYLALGDPLYALGELATVGGTRGPFDRRAEVGALLSEWKRDPTNLRERFDADRDGEVNLAEWAKAREAAQREVDRRHLETGPPAALHLLRAPADGRPYLVSNRDPLALARSSRFWAWLHVAVLVLAAVWALVLWKHTISDG